MRAIGGSGSGASTVGAVRHTVSGPLLVADSTANDGRVLIIVTDAEAETRWVNVAVTEDEQSTEDRLGEEVENAIEDGLRIGSNDVTSFRNTPGNGVDNPENGGEGTTHQEHATNILAQVVGVDAGFPGELVDDIDQGGAA